MQINTASFVISSSHYKKCPATTFPEYAFVGRSNVGKSSLINMLIDQKGLAKTSSTPGKTQLINHFIINEKWYLVDLPGYGYAKVPKKISEKWQQTTKDYLLNRANLMCLFVLLDIRLKPQKNDLEFMTWLGEREIPFAMVFTKEDKISKTHLQSRITEYEDEMLKSWQHLPHRFSTSAANSNGREELLGYIEEINKENAESPK